MIGPSPERTALGREASRTAALARVQAAGNADILNELGARLRKRPPRLVVTCARGSSDHAATYGKTIIETFVGAPVASIGMSVASVYRRPLDLRDALFIAVSQSGRSTDLLRLTETAKAGGALVVGLINDESSPLAALVDIPVPLRAGVEESVAATKSHLLSCRAFLDLAARWTGDPRLRDALDALPDALDAAAGLDWSPAIGSLRNERSMFVLGRGPSLGCAMEVALKLKETCALHAEAFSAAEMIHGPAALVGPGFPALALGQEDEAAPSIRSAVARVLELGGRVISTLDTPGAIVLPTVPGVDPVTAPLTQVLSFYLAVQHLARDRGYDPDHPTHLRKITETC